MSAKFQIGSLVEFTRDKYSEEEGEHIPYAEKYFAGKQGYVVSADSDGENSEYKYTIRVGLTDILGVPESDLKNPNAKLQDIVEKKLRKAQENKEFKDTEGRIGGSKKEKSAYKRITMGDLISIEEDEATAIELIKKDKVYPKVDVAAERDKGVSSGAAYLKVKLREAFGSEPPNNKDKRKVYVGYVNYLVSAMENIFTVDAFDNFVRNKTVKVGLKEIIGILSPELLEQIDEQRAENKIKHDEIWGKIRQLEAANSVLLLDIEKKHNHLFNEYLAFTWASVPEDEKQAYHSVKKINDDEINRLKSSLKKHNPDFSEIESDFISSLSDGQYDSYYYADHVVIGMFEAVFGKRFVNFIGKNLYENVEKAKEFDSISVEESIRIIDEKTKYDAENLTEKKKYLEELSMLVTKEQHDDFFLNQNNGRHGSVGYHISYFGGTGKKWLYYKDLVGQNQITIYKEQYKRYLQESISSLEKKIEAVKEKYKPRESDWDWYFGKGKTPDGEDKKKRPELTVNVYPPLSHIVRKGGIKIVEEDINPESIRKKFGFKEVEFGQSLKDKEAKEHVRHFLGAMADLADILNMDVVQLNVLGGLSIAFASRGSGKASAHYEPLRKVINVTKTRGGGAIAHEYMHYLDNIIPKIGREGEYTYKEWASVFKEDRYGRKTSYIENNAIFKAVDYIFQYIYRRTFSADAFNAMDFAPEEKEAVLKSLKERGEKPNEVQQLVYASDKRFSLPAQFYKSDVGYYKPTDIDDYFANFKNSYTQYRFVDNLKSRDYDVLGAIVKMYGFKEYMFTFQTKQSMYYANSRKMSSDYWSREWELFARAFETYIWDKLNKAARENNYLVQGAYFDSPAGVYPAGDERKDLFLLYDLLMKTIKQQYGIADFKPWTTERVDEFIALEGDKNETIEGGVIVNAKTKKKVAVIEPESTEEVKTKKIGPFEEAQMLGRKRKVFEKMQELYELLKTNKMEAGGTVLDNQDHINTLTNYLLTLKQ
jgi:hypothetical protein